MTTATSEFEPSSPSKTRRDTIFFNKPTLKLGFSFFRHQLGFFVVITIALFILYFDQGDGTTNFDTNITLSSSSSSSSSPIRVLITRTVSPSETSIVAADVAHVKSFYLDQQTQQHLLEKSKSHCNQLNRHNGSSIPDPYEINSSIFPNYLLCMNDTTTTALTSYNTNYFSRVEADFMLFARSLDHADQLREEIEKLSTSRNETADIIVDSHIRHQHTVDVDIRDTSSNPKKIYNWVLHADKERLQTYDYIWFIDGDIQLNSLNWQAFWLNVNVMKPKISQPGMIGASVDQPGTSWTTLRYQTDARIIAAEVPIVEVQAPLLEVETWLQYRDMMFNNPSVMNDIRLGGENCFDMGWCHLAKTNMTGKQEPGKMWDKDIDYSRGVEMDMNENSTVKERACMVFHQTPLQHITKGTRVVDAVFKQATANLCKFLREEKGVFGKGGSWTVYELFNAPNISIRA